MTTTHVLHVLLVNSNSVLVIYYNVMGVVSTGTAMQNAAVTPVAWRA